MKTSSIFRRGGVARLISALIDAAFIFGGIYYVLWCLKHFGVIGG